MNILFFVFLIVVAVLLFGPWEFGKKESPEAAVLREETKAPPDSWRGTVSAGLIFLALAVVALWFRARLLWAHAVFLLAAGLILAAQGIYLRASARGR